MSGVRSLLMSTGIGLQLGLIDEVHLQVADEALQLTICGFVEVRLQLAGEESNAVDGLFRLRQVAIDLSRVGVRDESHCLPRSLVQDVHAHEESVSQGKVREVLIWVARVETGFRWL